MHIVQQVQNIHNLVKCRVGIRLLLTKSGVLFTLLKNTMLRAFLSKVEPVN